ncbi:MAG: S1 family peptidase [Myxococcaceae bacterium]|nr:S1 family peptidase [Myxococcaceae bacterium]
MKSRRVFSCWVTVVGAALTACGAEPLQRHADESTQAVLGGQVAMNDWAVVGIGFKQQGIYTSYCTGTLIGPKTVLSAAHCANQGIHFGTGPNDHPYAIFATYENQPHFVVKVVREVANPARVPMSRDDFSVMELAEEVTGVAPLKLNDAPFSQADVGKMFRHVGFGLDNPNAETGIGTKREVTHAITGVSEYLLQSGDMFRATCGGDSGGPSLMVTPGSTEERVVGVVSWGQGVCGNGWDGRVDQALDWVRTTMAQWETPRCEADDLCKKDCLTPDPDCRELLQACSGVNQCLTGVCYQEPAGSYCSNMCASDAQCPLAASCQAGWCLRRSVPKPVEAQPLTSFSAPTPQGCASAPWGWSVLALAAWLAARRRVVSA